jgi:hypothetical protein
MSIEKITGLNQRAYDILDLKRNEKITIKVRELGHRIFPDGAVEPFEREVEHSLPGYRYIEFDYRCGRYEFVGGRVFEEVVQAKSINGADLDFAYLALKDGSGQIVEASLWTSEEIAEQEAVLALAP